MHWNGKPAARGGIFQQAGDICYNRLLFLAVRTMTASKSGFIGQIFSRNMLVCIFTGFASGLPLYFLINLIPAWLRSEQVDLKSIGLMALIGLPFTWKFCGRR